MHRRASSASRPKISAACLWSSMAAARCAAVRAVAASNDTADAGGRQLLGHHKMQRNPYESEGVSRGSNVVVFARAWWRGK